jgi:outer membrane protein assembly factor BamC
MKLIFTRTLLPMLAVGLLTGCSSFSLDTVLPDNSVEYRKDKAAGKNLEVPPDLTGGSIKDRLTVPSLGSASVSYSELQDDTRLRGQGRAGDVLPEIRGIQMMRDGDSRWLLIDGDADTVWSRTLDFWQESGVLLVEQDPVVGVMRTSWLENRASIGTDFITDTLRSVFDGLYDAGTRDQYRVRLERVGEGRTELYMTHFGVEEEIVTDRGGTAEQSVWNRRPRDPQLEAEMLRRLMVHLGLEENRAKAQLASGQQAGGQRAQLISNDRASSLTIEQDFPRAWRLAGLALDRIGFAVQDRDRNAGVYYVQYTDPEAAQSEDKGWFDKLAFWRDEELPEDLTKLYQVQVKAAAAGKTVVTIHDDKGQRLNTKVARRILTLMQEQLR